jgi:hypothetical protein
MISDPRRECVLLGSLVSLYQSYPFLAFKHYGKDSGSIENKTTKRPVQIMMMLRNCACGHSH